MLSVDASNNFVDFQNVKYERQKFRDVRSEMIKLNQILFEHTRSDLLGMLTLIQSYVVFLHLHVINSIVYLTKETNGTKY